MNKKIFLLGFVLLIAGRLFAEPEMQLVTVSADGSETMYALADVQKIVFEDNAMTVNMKDGLEATGITCISFLLLDVGIKNPPFASSVFVFPNPVTTKLTVAGADKSAKINLFDLSGKLLQSVLAQDNSTDINVSSLPQGIYLLQVGEQIIKFIKQ